MNELTEGIDALAERSFELSHVREDYAHLMNLSRFHNKSYKAYCV